MPVDPITATAAVSFVSAYLSKMGEGAAGILGEAVAEALRQSNNAPSACAALIRQAGQALARLTSHDQAARLHAQLARRHAERAARCWRP